MRRASGARGATSSAASSDEAGRTPLLELGSDKWERRQRAIEAKAMLSGRQQNTPMRSYEVVEYAKGTLADHFFKHTNTIMRQDDFWNCIMRPQDLTMENRSLAFEMLSGGGAIVEHNFAAECRRAGPIWSAGGTASESWRALMRSRS